MKFTAPFLKKSKSKISVHWYRIVVDLYLVTRSWFIFSCIFVLTIWIVQLWTTERADWKLFRFFDQSGKTILILAVALQFILWGLHFIREWGRRDFEKTMKDSKPTLGLFYTTLQGILIVSVILIALSNLGIDIRGWVAGIGIGGIAIALAAQNILADFLASLSIVLDKPFTTGDYIIVGEEQGEVENIGIKTTRVRSLTGEELIFSNKDLLNSRIRNYKHMWRRRVSHKIALKPNITEEKIRKLPERIKDLFIHYKNLTFERCHLISFGDSSLIFELVFWVESPKYEIYVDLQQSILFDIFFLLKKEDIEWGYPTRILHFEKEGYPLTYGEKSQSTFL